MVLQVDKANVNMALSVLSTNTSAATFLASISLTLGSVIGAWLGNSSSNNLFENKLIYGDTRPATISIKYICLLTCFVLAFACFIQSTRYFIHATYLITTPGNDIPPEIVKNTVVRGGDFWSIGLRSLYFAFNFLLWFFGPIPMFVSSIVIVIILHYLDTNSTPTPLYHQRFLGGQVGKRLDI